MLRVRAQFGETNLWHVRLRLRSGFVGETRRDVGVTVHGRKTGLHIRDHRWMSARLGHVLPVAPRISFVMASLFKTRGIENGAVIGAPQPVEHAVFELFRLRPGRLEAQRLHVPHCRTEGCSNDPVHIGEAVGKETAWQPSK